MPREGTPADARPDPRPDALPEALLRRYLIEFDTDELVSHESDVLVIGSGIAGLTAALATPGDVRVALVTKGRVVETATWYAQGGIAGAVSEADSVDLHVQDTLEAGAGLCDEAVVRTVVEEATSALDDLRDRGVSFDTSPGGAVHLHREGGHSLPRVLHSGDTTGAEVQDTLTGLVKGARNVDLFEERFLVDLLTAGDRCVGALVHDPASRRLEVYWAGATVLASGGAGQLYRTTTNPHMATGDGIAAAWRAGATLSDLEFVQFHPTALDSREDPRFLITEALRGEGAELLDCEGRPFMPGAHPQGDLAPRDVVTAEIERVMRRCGTTHVWLDARHLGDERLERRFPAIRRRCAEAGFDLSTDLIPVAPAAHYLIGGVTIDVDGRTSLPGLYASGECTSSGLHGANRLASNSLLEGLVFSRRIVRAIDESGARAPSTPRVVSGEAEETAVMTAPVARHTVQGVMSGFVATTRSEGSLLEASIMLRDLTPLLGVALRRTYEMELQNLLTVALLVTHAAWYREETRGAHRRSDFPERDDARWRVHTRWRRGEAPREQPVRIDAPEGGA